MDWLGSKLKKLTDNLTFHDNPLCINCQKPGVMMFPDSSGRYVVCNDQRCHLAVFQMYQHDLDNRTCKLPGCGKKCFIETNGMVYDFCSKSHANQYQKMPNQNYQKQQQQHYHHHHQQQQQQQHYQQQQQQHYQQQQQYYQQQQSHYPKQQYQQHAYEKICRLPECKKTCYTEHGKTYDFCGKSHAEMYKMRYGQKTQPNYYALHGQQQRGNALHYQSPHWAHTNEIYFYNRDEPYYEFTNFASFPVIIDNQCWPTTEHYFQAQKFIGTPYEGAIRQLSFPREAFDFSRKPEVSNWRRKDWEEVKDDVMYKALLAKFRQHEKLLKLLLGTENRKLVEHTKNDSYWGDGGDGTGKNRLGELLMKVRQTLRASNVISLPTPQSPKLDYEQMQSSSPSSPHCGKKPDEDTDIDLMEVDSAPDNQGAVSEGPEIPMVNRQGAIVDELLSMSKAPPFNSTTQPLDTSPSTVALQSNLPITSNMSVTMSTAVDYGSQSFTTSFTTQCNMPVMSSTSVTMSTAVGSTSQEFTTSSTASDVYTQASTSVSLVGKPVPSPPPTTNTSYAQAVISGPNPPHLRPHLVAQTAGTSGYGAMQRPGE